MILDLADFVKLAQTLILLFKDFLHFLYNLWPITQFHHYYNAVT